MSRKTTGEKPAPLQAPVTSPRRPARKLESTRQKRCVVCSGEVAPFSNEDLCWVCRRLKISAWRETDSQMSMQE